MTGRERVLAHLRGEPVDHLPVMPITMMFASDQIGAPYKAYVTDFRVLAEAQVYTARKFGFDYVSVISDPAREAADLGAEIEWYEDQPPALVESKSLLADKSVLKRLTLPDPCGGGRMHDRIKAIGRLKELAGEELLVEGWIEGPAAQAADLRGINRLMGDLYDDPAFVEELMDFVVELELKFAEAQVVAGADLIGIGDAASSLIGPRFYERFVFPRTQKMVSEIHRMGALARLHICGRTRKLLPWMGKVGADIVDLDWMVPLDEARRECGAGQVLLGNIDPVAVLRNGTPQTVQQKLAECFEHAGPRYIVGAGCEVVRDTPEENVRAMVEFARAHSPR